MSVTVMSNVYLVTIALANLGGHEKAVDSEDLAIHVNELAPGKFTWRKYPQYIDIQIVNQALYDARRPRNGRLVFGSNTKGWTLTKSGMQWIQNLSKNKDLRASNMVGSGKGSLLLSLEIELERLYRTRAYQLFSGGDLENITLDDFYSFVKINEYFSAKARNRRLALVESAVDAGEDLKSLWRYFKNTFAEEFA